jgi:hypothetical protein
VHVQLRSLIGVATLAVALAGCASTTPGTGHASIEASAPATSLPSGQNTGATFGVPTPGSSAPSSAAPSSKPAGSPTTLPIPAQPVLTKSVVADGGRTYVVKVWAQTQDVDCAGHAYGAPVVAFLKQHPCAGLSRLLVTTTVHGRPVGFAQNSIGFKGPTAQAVYQAAGRFRALVTKDGTGNLNDLLREGYRLPSGPTSVPYPDAFLALSQDNSVSIVDAWYLQGSTPDNDPALIHMAKDIYLQF